MITASEKAPNQRQVDVQTKVRAILVVALSSACAPRALAPSEWREAPPAAPCEVVETVTDARGSDRRVSKYAADGRLLFAQTRLTYDGHGFEHVTWKHDRVVRIDSYYENEFRQGYCDVEGGCDEPAYRTIESTEYRYDSAGRLAVVDHYKREYRLRGTQWVEHEDDESVQRYVYKNGALVAITGGERGDVRFTWQHGHPVERQFDGQRSTYEWRDGRLVMYRWFDYEQSFEYDASGRLVREVLASKTASVDNPTTTEWSYDAAGRVISETRKTPREERPTTWTYDERGRVTSVAQDGRVDRTFEYSASCPANLGVVRAPSAQARANLAPCIRSPGYGYDNCYYAQR